MTAAGEPDMGEQQLILDARAGDDRAFRTLVERHMRQVYNVAYGLVKDHDEAEDIAQEVFVKAHAMLSSFRGEAGFGTWIYRITLNASFNGLQKRKRRAGHTVDLMNEAVANIGASDEHVESAEHRSLIERALHELPTLQRAVIILRHMEGLSTRQVSQILRCSEGTVKTHLFRGLKKMRSKLDFLYEGKG